MVGCEAKPQEATCALSLPEKLDQSRRECSVKTNTMRWQRGGGGRGAIRHHDGQSFTPPRDLERSTGSGGLEPQLEAAFQREYVHVGGQPGTLGTCGGMPAHVAHSLYGFS